MEKRKAQPRIRESRAQFYQYGWFFHLKYVARSVLTPTTTELMVTAASVGRRKEQAAFTAVVNDVVQQVAPAGKSWSTYFCPAASDPCLQIADYCAWAIRRKWEKEDARSYNLIRHKIRSEYDLFLGGKTFYY